MTVSLSLSLSVSLSLSLFVSLSLALSLSLSCLLAYEGSGAKTPGPKANPCLSLLPQGMRGLLNPPASWPPKLLLGLSEGVKVAFELFETVL